MGTSRCRPPIARDLEGHYAFVAMCDDEPDTLVGVRHECPLVVGIGDGEHFIASSISAFLAYTRTVTTLHDDEIVVLRPDAITVFDVAGLPAFRPRTSSTGMRSAARRMASRPSCSRRSTSRGRGRRDAVPMAGQPRRRVGRSPVGRAPADRQPDHRRRMRDLVPRRTGRPHAIERWAPIPVDVEVASVFRYRDPIIAPGTIVLAITQSGETADTLAAMRLARRAGPPCWPSPTPPAARPHANVTASCSLAPASRWASRRPRPSSPRSSLLYALALRLAGLAETLSAERCAELQSELELLPGRIDHVSARSTRARARSPRDSRGARSSCTSAGFPEYRLRWKGR